MSDSPRTECAWRATPIYKWREQAIIEWSWHVISIVACCHSVKFCALATRAFPIATIWCCDQDVNAKNNTHIYVSRTSNNGVISLERSWWMTSNNYACEASEQLIVLINGDDESDLIGWSLLLLAVTLWSNANREVATPSPPFYNEQQTIARSFCKVCTWHDLHILVTAPFCRDRKARAASAQSFTLWQQATIEITCHDRSIFACLRHLSAPDLGGT